MKYSRSARRNTRTQTPPPRLTPANSRLGPALWIAVALTMVSLAVFSEVRTHEFLLYDDPDYITNNREIRGGLTWHGLAWSFQTFAAGNWHPLTWISHMTDVQLFGLNSGAHHLVN